MKSPVSTDVTQTWDVTTDLEALSAGLQLLLRSVHGLGTPLGLEIPGPSLRDVFDDGLELRRRGLVRRLRMFNLEPRQLEDLVHGPGVPVHSPRHQHGRHRQGGMQNPCGLDERVSWLHVEPDAVARNHSHARPRSKVCQG